MSQWNKSGRLFYDKCAESAYYTQSKGPGSYMLNTPGLKPSDKISEYADKIDDHRAHQQKQYRSLAHVDEETKMRPKLTNANVINELHTRPYLGAYAGAGQRSLHKIDEESALIMGLDTRGTPLKACDVNAGSTAYRFEYLPEYGNPQRVQHVVEPWIRGGESTRDYVRRINYDATKAHMRNCGMHPRN